MERDIIAPFTQNEDDAFGVVTFSKTLERLPMKHVVFVAVEKLHMDCALMSKVGTTLVVLNIPAVGMLVIASVVTRMVIVSRISDTRQTLLAALAGVRNFL